MQDAYVVALEIPVEDGNAQVITRDRCLSELDWWEPIATAATEEEAVRLKEEWEKRRLKLGVLLSREAIGGICEKAGRDCDSCTLGAGICPEYTEGGYDRNGYQRVCCVDDDTYEDEA